MMSGGGGGATHASDEIHDVNGASGPTRRGVMDDRERGTQSGQSRMKKKKKKTRRRRRRKSTCATRTFFPDL